MGHYGKRLLEKFQMKEGRGQVESTLHLQPDGCGLWVQVTVLPHPNKDKEIYVSKIVLWKNLRTN